MKHLIRKQVITLQLDATQNAFSIQQQVRDYYYENITPVLEKLFDEFSSENEIMNIERLEIDLGQLGWRNERFTLDNESLYRVLKQSLSKTLSASGNNRNPEAVVSYRTLEKNTCLQWLYYLENGVLPWEAQITHAKWLEQILHQLAIDHVLIEKTKTLIIHDPWFLARLVREHHEEFLQKLVEVITAKRQPELIEQARALANQSNDGSVEIYFTKNEIWEQVLKHYAAGKADVDFLKTLLIEKKVIPESHDRFDQEMILEGKFCRYAGLVLLHPFFRHLFNHLLLLDDGMFKNTASLEKAVVLLYFIATGNKEPRDYELVVPKIFCGMQLHEVINEKSFRLTEMEQEEALNMLHAAIKQWDFIRNTSVEGLRESFLAREGKLLIKESGIEFRIESRGIDVLLDRLPWNLSLIKFPWLDKLIHVEWR